MLFVAEDFMLTRDPTDFPMPRPGESHPWLDTLRPERVFFFGIKDSARKITGWDSAWAIDPDAFYELHGGRSDGNVINLSQIAKLKKERPWAELTYEEIHRPQEKITFFSRAKNWLGKIFSEKENSWWAVSAYEPKANGNEVRWMDHAAWIQAKSAQEAIEKWMGETRRPRSHLAFPCALSLKEVRWAERFCMLEWCGRNRQDFGGAMWHGRLPSPAFLRREFQKGEDFFSEWDDSRPMPNISALNPSDKFAHSEQELLAQLRQKPLSDAILRGGVHPNGLQCEAPLKNRGCRWLDVSDYRLGAVHDWDERVAPGMLIVWREKNQEDGGRIRWRVATAWTPVEFLAKQRDLKSRPDMFFSLDHMAQWETQKRNAKEWDASQFGAPDRQWAVAWWEEKKATGSVSQWMPKAAWIRASTLLEAKRKALKISSGRARSVFAFKETDLAALQPMARRAWAGFLPPSESGYGGLDLAPDMTLREILKKIGASASWSAFEQAGFPRTFEKNEFLKNQRKKQEARLWIKAPRNQ